MPNENSGQDVQQESGQQGTGIPLSVDQRRGIPTDTVSGDSNEANVSLLKKLGNRIKDPEHLMIVLTAAMAFAALCGVVVGSFQWITMKGQLQEMRETGKQTDALIQQTTAQAIAATKLAEIANASLGETKRQFEQGQRPYVVPFIVPTEPTGGTRIRADLVIPNYGRSPAVRVAVGGTIFFGKDAMKQADIWFALRAPEIFNASSGTVIPPSILNDPRQLNTVTSKTIITQQEVESVVRTDYSIVVVSRHVYFDSAGNRYWTDSCFSYLATKAIPRCPKHNEVH
ncbi:MAG: hypothetical protein HY847_03355 [Betaproteobacteria bacterium]|nr:hypothetical protein [Betaproteobacteria bacterium]